MTEMTREAQGHLEAYLQQVARLARIQGDDAPEIVEGLREHINGELAELATDAATLDDLRTILERIGTPEEIMELDAPLSGLGTRPGQAGLDLAAEVRSDRRNRQRVVRGCLIAAAVGAVLVVVPMLVFVFLLAAPSG